MFLEVDIQYPEKFHKLHNDLPFLCEKKVKIKKVGELVANLRVLHTHKRSKTIIKSLISIEKSIESLNLIKSLAKIIH